MGSVEELIRQYRHDEPSSDQLRQDVMALRHRIRGLIQDNGQNNERMLKQLRENLRVLEQEMLIAEYVEDCIRVTLNENNIQAALDGDDTPDFDSEED
ncbi:MAG: hypothetical protein ACYC1M_05915 [Armatimonadota bacterium]